LPTKSTHGRIFLSKEFIKLLINYLINKSNRLLLGEDDND